eukprot:CAMPEP_0116022930 /NCGR_PEP_ID=MMETSP0321-20121206/11274_1 /TAXON_ID=163516 /ORGANISM="Leptocylindrus danicus var. danicus, Strain B650" /LENGTH=246 /DNA_ID=CAMNT_0003494083 /DNA_START=764 /DNA_END=1505 /DNA_ORIENTATION=-
MTMTHLLNLLKATAKVAYVSDIPFIELRGLYYDNDCSVPMIYKGMISKCRAQPAPKLGRSRSRKTEHRPYVQVLVESDSVNNDKIDVRLYTKKEIVTCRIEDLLFLHVSPALAAQYCKGRDLRSGDSFVAFPSSSTKNLVVRTHDNQTCNGMAKNHLSFDCSEVDNASQKLGDHETGEINPDGDVVSEDESLWKDDAMEKEVGENKERLVGKRKSRGVRSVVRLSRVSHVLSIDLCHIMCSQKIVP